MSNPMKYIRDLEAAGFARSQAEAQVQMVLDAIEGDLMDLVTKSDFANFQERMDNRFALFQQQTQHELQQMQTQIRESAFRLITRLGFLMISTTSIAVALLTWLIKV